MKQQIVSPTSIVNIGLKRDLKEILDKPENIIKVYKGIGKVTDFSIEIWFKEPATFSSYVYYSNKEKMEADFNNLESLIKQQKVVKEKK